MTIVHSVPSIFTSLPSVEEYWIALALDIDRLYMSGLYTDRIK